MLNVLVTGSNGQLGSEIKNIIQHSTFNIQHYNFYFTNKSKLDIVNKSKIEEFVNKNNIKIIINCAAYTAVDMAEDEKELAYKINVDAVKNLAKIAKQKDITLVHISTDYVFDGQNYKPYKEEDKTNPINYYGYTKLEGEKVIQEVNPKGCIIRTSWVYSSFGNNFVKTMLRLAKQRDSLKVIFDQIGTPTYAKDLAKVILNILPKLQNSDMKIYNYSNEGVCSWYDFAHEIFSIKGIKCQVQPIHSSQYPTKAKRPHFSLLDKTKIKEDFGITVPYWMDSLKECLKEID